MLPVAFPSTKSCSEILTRSEPPTNATITFLRRARRTSIISGETLCRRKVSPNAMLAKKKNCELDVLESTFHPRQIDKVSSEACLQIRGIPLKKGVSKQVGSQDE